MLVPAHNVTITTWPGAAQHCKSCSALARSADEGVRVGAQDPSYPVYVDSSVIMGMTGVYQEGRGFGGITYMPCRPDTSFFPDLTTARAPSSLLVADRFKQNVHLGRSAPVLSSKQRALVRTATVSAQQPRGIH